MYKELNCESQPIAFLPFLFTSPSSLLKLPIVSESDSPSGPCHSVKQHERMNI